MKKIKVVILKAPSEAPFKAGDVIEATGAKLDEMSAAGVDYITASEQEANESVRKQTERITKAREATVQRAIDAGVVKGIFLPKEDTATVKAKALKMEEFSDGMGVEYIEGLPTKASGTDPLKGRSTSGTEGGGDRQLVKAGDLSFRDTFREYCTASEPFRKTHREGGIIGNCKGTDEQISRSMEEATRLARAKGAVVGRISDMIKAGANYSWDEVVKAADYVDPAGSNPLGTLNTDLLLNFNFGHLENQLALLDDITTDISDTPVMFNQTALTRYIQVPGFQSKAYNAAWAAATGASVDVNVKMDKYIGVPLAWNNNYMGATTRNLPNEFRTAQMYAIGEAIIYYLINNIINGNSRVANDGSTVTTIKPNGKPDGKTAGKAFNIANPTVSTFTSALRSAMNLAKFPGGDETEEDADLMRFIWAHTTVYASLTADTNVLINQTLQRIYSKLNPNTFATGMLNRVGNARIRESQLFNDQNTLTADPNNASSTVVSTGDYTAATTLGVAGTRSGLIFTSRLPLDYTKQLGVQGGFAIEVATTPKLGIKMAVVKFLDHAYETANMRAALMFGTSIGDERQLFPLNVK
jgi:hypothetical protein